MKFYSVFFLSLCFVQVKDAAPDQRSSNIVLVSVALTTCVSIIIVFLILYYFKFRRQNRFDLDILIGGRSGMANLHTPLQEQAELLPYDPYFQLKPKNLELGKVLGRGNFGKVVKARVLKFEATIPYETIAVKIVKEKYDHSQYKALVGELKILMHLRRHVNVVNLLGCVTKYLYEGKLMVLFEYCCYGDLRTFLLDNRHTFIDQVELETGVFHPKTLNYDFEFGNNEQNERIDSTTVTFTNGQDNNNQLRLFLPKKRGEKYSGILTTNDLVCYCFQIARGMRYLESRQFIHRELRAKNVLVCEGNVVKISGLASSQEMYRYWNYLEKEELPKIVKWMALESLQDKQFTTKSDVWAFAVLLWEIFTLGDEPYSDIETLEQLHRKIKNGYRLDGPQFAPKVIYQIMLNCWDIVPENRFDFNKLSNKIGAMLEKRLKDYFINLNYTYEQWNENYLRRNYGHDSPSSPRRAEENEYSVSPF